MSPTLQLMPTHTVLYLPPSPTSSLMYAQFGLGERNIVPN
jgi:hypothetical protein